MAVGVLEGVANSLWGFKPNLMRPIIEQKGAIAGLTWFVSNMPRYESTRKAFGPVRMHSICTLISVLNGCRYCTYGHAYALQLSYLRERDRLFPLDEHEIVSMSRLDEDQAIERYEAALQTAGLVDETAPLRRMLAIRAGESPAKTDADGARIKHLLSMFSVLNACGIASQASPDQAHDPLNKDRALVQRYLDLRAASESKH
ncbi:MAG TPA: hypothetical protein VGV88_13715 [Candidatus Dormibacteraeota bacterium]|nr:hypothetical protein [Candidatus Dormibacteraeota bacterium]